MTLEAAHRVLLDWLDRQARCRVVEDEGTYIRAEFTSAVLGFVDDVELLLVPEAGLLHFRSASRVGYSDLGVNRRRMERLSRELAERGFSVSPPG